LIWTRSLLVYVKIPLLAVLVGTLYWRDFFAFWQTGVYTGWIIYTLVVLLLVTVLVFQRRHAIKTLLLLSETRASHGVTLVLAALVFYIVGSYTPYALWLHLLSMVLFVAGYLTIVIDSRISKMLFLPLLALLFVTPPIQIEVFKAQNLPTLVILNLSVDAVIVALLARIISASRWKKAGDILEQATLSENETEQKHCPLCQSDKFQEETFCLNCGRQRFQPEPKSLTSTFLKFLTLLMIVLVLSLVYLPVLSLSNKNASLTLYAAHGIEEQLIVPTPDGWKLESSDRLVEYEKEHFEDFVEVSTYSSERFNQTRSYIQLEIGSRTPYLRNNWRLPDWERTRQDVFLDGLSARFILLQKENNTITVLYWIMKPLFKVGSVFSPRDVGVSIFANFTQPVAELKVSEVLSEFLQAGRSLLSSLVYANNWTLNFLSVNGIYDRFGDIFFAVVGAAAVFASAGWVRTKDEKADKLTENALILIEDEAKLLIAISMLKQRRFLGKQLFDVYQRVTKSKVGAKEFYEKLKLLSTFGLLKNDYILQDSELRMVWKRLLI